MDTWLLMLQSMILGIVEGITEFLPISSTGHLIITQNLIGFNAVRADYLEMYTYVIQLGAILAVVVLYWKKIQDTLLHFFPKKSGYEESGFRFWLMIVIACIPGGVFGILLDDLAEQYLFSPYTVAIALFVGAIFMIFAENRYRGQNGGIDELKLSPKQAILIGLFQCLAIIPGMSRSASTIIGGWIAGLSTVAAAEFSFFLAIPVMVGMSFLKIVKMDGFGLMSAAEWSALAVGFIVSFLVALVVIRGFINYLKHKPMKIFAKYRMVFAVLVIAAGVMGFFH